MEDDFTSIAAGLPDPFKLLIKESVGSTNDELRKLAAAGAPEGLILLALRQTQGRGRRGAAWFSPPGESLAFSVLIRPGEPKSLWPRLALAAGLAVAEALEAHVPLVGIKWPNDVWVRGKKIAGLLVEAGKDYAIVGIGLNVNTRLFPPEVSETATSMALETGTELSRPELFAAIIRHLATRRHQIGVDFPNVIKAINQRCVLAGNHVALLTAEGPRTGKVEGISPHGELLLRSASGLVSLLQADEIRITAAESPMP